MDGLKRSEAEKVWVQVAWDIKLISREKQRMALEVELPLSPDKERPFERIDRSLN